MSFQFVDKSGNVVRRIYSCTNCIYCSVKQHFREGKFCPLCGSEGEEIETQKEGTGMSEFRYRRMLDYIEEETAGVGSATRQSIESYFNQGDEFVDATYKELTEVDGIGTSTAENISDKIEEYQK